LIEVFEDIQRHQLKGGPEPVEFTTALTPVQRRILRLLGIPRSDYNG
jgi:hypothetical protein